MRVSPVGIGPRDPWTNLAPPGVLDNTPDGYRDGEAEINGSHNNEAQVTAVSQLAAGDEILEPVPCPDEHTDGED